MIERVTRRIALQKEAGSNHGWRQTEMIGSEGICKYLTGTMIRRKFG